LVSGAPGAGRSTLAAPHGAFEELQRPVGVGPVVEVDTTTSVDVSALADDVVRVLGAGSVRS
jgi:hypothetical protein